MFYYSAVLLWPQQIQALYTKDVTYAGWLSVSLLAIFPSSCIAASDAPLGLLKET
jgi:hypothetical protein